MWDWELCILVVSFFCLTTRWLFKKIWFFGEYCFSQEHSCKWSLRSSSFKKFRKTLFEVTSLYMKYWFINTHKSETSALQWMVLVWKRITASIFLTSVFHLSVFASSVLSLSVFQVCVSYRFYFYPVSYFENSSSASVETVWEYYGKVVFNSLEKFSDCFSNKRHNTSSSTFHKHTAENVFSNAKC